MNKAVPMTGWPIRRMLLVCCLSLVGFPARMRGASFAAADQGEQVTIPAALQFDLASKITGQTYRIMVATPREQYRGTDPKQRQRAEQTRMVDNARELSARLQAIRAENLQVVYSVFADEDHVSASQANLARALRYALKSD